MDRKRPVQTTRGRGTYTFEGEKTAGPRAVAHKKQGTCFREKSVFFGTPVLASREGGNAQDLGLLGGFDGTDWN